MKNKQFVYFQLGTLQTMSHGNTATTARRGSPSSIRLLLESNQLGWIFFGSDRPEHPSYSRQNIFECQLPCGFTPLVSNSIMNKL